MLTKSVWKLNKLITKLTFDCRFCIKMEKQDHKEANPFESQKGLDDRGEVEYKEKNSKDWRGDNLPWLGVSGAQSPRKPTYFIDTASLKSVS